MLADWFPDYKPLAEPTFRILAFHGAGGDSNVYLSQGTARKPLPNPLIEFCKSNEVELLALHLPGRTRRHREKRLRSTQGVADEVFKLIDPLLNVPYAVVGHSMGCFVAYEVMKLAAAAKRPLPRRAFFTCMVSPDTPQEQLPWGVSKDMTSKELQLECKEWNISEEVFNKDMWELYEPILRDDFQVLETYIFGQTPPETKMKVPKVCVYVAEHDKRVPKSTAEGWEMFVGEEFELLEIEGNHNFVYEAEPRRAWLQRITDEVDYAVWEASQGF